MSCMSEFRLQYVTHISFLVHSCFNFRHADECHVFMIDPFRTPSVHPLSLHLAKTLALRCTATSWPTWLTQWPITRSQKSHCPAPKQLLDFKDPGNSIGHEAKSAFSKPNICCSRHDPFSTQTKIQSNQNHKVCDHRLSTLLCHSHPYHD